MPGHEFTLTYASTGYAVYFAAHRTASGGFEPAGNDSSFFKLLSLSFAPDFSQYGLFYELIACLYPVASTSTFNLVFARRPSPIIVRDFWATF